MDFIESISESIDDVFRNSYNDSDNATQENSDVHEVKSTIQVEFPSHSVDLSDPKNTIESVAKVSDDSVDLKKIEPSIAGISARNTMSSSCTEESIQRDSGSITFDVSKIDTDDYDRTGTSINVELLIKRLQNKMDQVLKKQSEIQSHLDGTESPPFGNKLNELAGQVERIQRIIGQADNTGIDSTSPQSVENDYNHHQPQYRIQDAYRNLYVDTAPISIRSLASLTSAPHAHGCDTFWLRCFAGKSQSFGDAEAALMKNEENPLFFAFSGQHGTLAVVLGRRINVKSFTIEKPITTVNPQDGLPVNENCRPKHLRIYGILDSPAMYEILFHPRYRSRITTMNIDSSTAFLLSEADVEYETDGTAHMTTLDDTPAFSWRTIVLEISSNYGSQEFTCIGSFAIDAF